MTLKCTGSGFSLAQLTYQFNLNSVEMSPRFKLSVQVDKNTNDYNLNLNICTSFIPGLDGNSSSMAVVEVELPSCFVADLQTIQEKLKDNTDVKKIETKNGNTVVVFYLDNVGPIQICLQVIAYRMCQIADEKPVSVQVYDYYNNSEYWRSENILSKFNVLPFSNNFNFPVNRKTEFYQTKSKDLCRICVEDECKKACSKPITDLTCPKKG